MGSLTSQPKAPTQAPVVYYVQTPTYVYEPAPTSSASGSTSGSSSGTGSNTGTSSNDTTVSPETEQAVAEQKAENLLKRSRSRLSTVLTGFRGVLEQSDLAPQRKTLLGE